MREVTQNVKSVIADQEETLEHFLVGCTRYQELRVQYGVVGKSFGDILLFTGVVGTEGCYLKDIWEQFGKEMHRGRSGR